MKPGEWERIQELFVEALARDAAEREAFVVEAAGADAALRDEVLSLLASHEQAESFIEESPLGRPSEALEAGTVVGERYRIDGILGRGGMGAVYRATQIALERQVAIKVIRRESVAGADAAERFKREALAVARLRHPNIVAVHDFGVDATVGAYLVLELLSGRSLGDEIRAAGAFEPGCAVEIARQILSAVQAAHEAGVVHRDLKPSNVFVEETADGPLVKVLDFGIAKLHGSDDATITEIGAAIGTPAYMAPEQCEGRSVDARTDVYAVGAILYQMLAGRPVFEADTPLGVMYKQVHDAPEPLARVAPGTPAPLAAAVMRMLAKRPDERFASAADAARALTGAADRTSPNRARRVAPWIAAALLVAAAAATAAFWPRTQSTVQSPSPPPAPASDELSDAAFALVPGGEVAIGRDPDESEDAPGQKIEPDESPAHRVALAPYYIARYEVTNREYQEFVAATSHPAPKHWHGTYPLGTDDYPVTNVTWDDAAAYCAWRAKRDGVAFRLPTEAEWEHAARGDDARLFPWGNVWNDAFANANRPAGSGTALPVAEAPNATTDRSPLGVFGLAGNASEWTASAFEPYPGSAYRPKGNDLASKVLRGGSFNLQPISSRTTYRNWQLPAFTAPDVGFRLAATPRGRQ